LESGEVILGQKLISPASLLMFVERFQEGRKFSYEILLGIGSTLNQCVLSFDATRVQWSLRMQAFAHPSGGLIRYFCSVTLSADMAFVYAGTTGGDLLVYRRSSCVYRACIPVCSNGVQSIVCLQDG